MIQNTKNWNNHWHNKEILRGILNIQSLRSPCRKWTSGRKLAGAYYPDTTKQNKLIK